MTTTSSYYHRLARHYGARFPEVLRMLAEGRLEQLDNHGRDVAVLDYTIQLAGAGDDADELIDVLTRMDAEVAQLPLTWLEKMQ